MTRCDRCHRPLRSPSSILRGMGLACWKAKNAASSQIDPAYYNPKQISLLDMLEISELHLAQTFGIPPSIIDESYVGESGQKPKFTDGENHHG